jgi:hypothetical protein
MPSNSDDLKKKLGKCLKDIILKITRVFFFKFGIEVEVEESIVNALYGLRITDQLFKSYAFTRVVLNRLPNANFNAKLKKKTLYGSNTFILKKIH